MFKSFLDKVNNIDKKIFYGGFIVLGIVLFILALIFCFNVFEKTDGKKFAKEYERLNGEKSVDGKLYPSVEIASDNVMKYVTTDEIINTFEIKGDAVVYLGYASCIYCRNVVPVLLDAASKKGLEIIYYLDVENQGAELSELYKLLGDELLNDVGVIEAPVVIFIVNGQVSGYNKGTLFSQEDPYQPLDVYQVKGLSGIYESGMNDVLDSLNNKKMNLSN